MKVEIDIEVWRPVLGYEGLYEVSDFGRVKSLHYNNTKKEQILKTARKGAGYIKVALHKKGKRQEIYLHRLVYESFKGKIPSGLTVDHINAIKEDNRLVNLQLLTHADNIRKAHLGRKLSAETRKKMSLAHLGKKYAPHKKKSKTFLLNLPPAISRFLKEEIHKEFPDEIVIEKGA